MQRWAAIATVVVTMVVGTSVTAAEATTSARVFVPCNTAALVKAINDANATPAKLTTLDLTPFCPYRLRAVDNTSDGANGLPVVVSGHLTINGRSAVISRGATVPPFRILEVGDRGNLTLNDVTVSGGSAARGGGILVDSGKLTANRSRISGNTATADFGGGAGIANGGVLALNFVTITGNTGRGEFVDGGGLENGGSAAVTNSLIDSNRLIGDNVSGAGLANVGGAATVTDSVISSNTMAGRRGADGGGIYNGATMALFDSVVAGNAAASPQDAEGGGIWNLGHLSVTRSRLAHNSATASAGRSSGPVQVGLGVVVPPRLTARASVRISSGTVQALGGGIVNLNTVRVRSSVIDDNTVSTTGQDSGAGGGGIANAVGFGAATARLEGTMVRGNAAQCSGVDCVAVGGAIWNSGTVHLTDHSPVSANTTRGMGAGAQALGGGIYNAGSALFGAVSLSDHSDVTRNSASAPRGTGAGGGIYNTGTASDVALSQSTVSLNRPDNCAGPGTPIAGCAG